jgi:hypothetical protein
VGSLAFPLLVLGFALGAVVYAGIAVWLVRAAMLAWQAIWRLAGDRRTRAELSDVDRRVAEMHPVGDAERAVRRAA